MYETCSIVNDCYETISTYISVFLNSVSQYQDKMNGCSNEFLFKETCRVTGRTSLFIHYHEQIEYARFRESQSISICISEGIKMTTMIFVAFLDVGNKIKMLLTSVYQYYRFGGLCNISYVKTLNLREMGCY